MTGDCHVRFCEKLAGKFRRLTHHELFNVMKNHGYYMERNYGHGQKNLAFNFYLLTLLALFFHQIAELTDKQYQACRKKFGSKKMVVLPLGHAYRQTAKQL